MTAKIVGISASHSIITPGCRSGRGRMEAFEEAVRRARVEYRMLAALECNEQADFHLALTVDQKTP